jgi:hypothetical protein
MPSKRSTDNRPGYDLFIAAPMSAVDEATYGEGRAGILATIQRLETAHGFGAIYFAGAEIGGSASFTDRGEALRRDFAALRNANLFALIYPAKIVTSALVEVGYALALRLPCLLLVRDKQDLPYLLNEAGDGVAGDTLPLIQIEALRGPEQNARAIAAFRDQLARGDDTHGREQG